LFPNASYAHFDTESGPLSAQWFCDKLATNLEPFVEPAGVVRPEHVAIGLFSGEQLFYTRASTTAATWLAHVTDVFMLASVHDWFKF
jgi:hypothetical protein